MSDQRLDRFLDVWLGSWPPSSSLDVVGAVQRTRPSWDGVVRPLIAVYTPGGAVVSVAPDRVDAVRDALAAGRPIGKAAGAPIFEAVFRATEEPVDLEPVGEWRPSNDPALPEWFAPFGGDVLVALDDDGRYLSGVGFKRHHPLGIELSVGTEPAARGKGLARRLVAIAARHVLDLGAVPLYLHEADNHASAIVADAAGFADRGWRIVEANPEETP